MSDDKIVVENKEETTDVGFKEVMECMQADSDLEHADKFVAGMESIISLLDSNDIHAIGGCERYTFGVLMANSCQYSLRNGSEGFIADAKKVAIDMANTVSNAFNTIFKANRMASKVIDDPKRSKAKPKPKKIRTWEDVLKEELTKPRVLSDGDYEAIFKNPSARLDNAKKILSTEPKTERDFEEHRHAACVKAVAEKITGNVIVRDAISKFMKTQDPLKYYHKNYQKFPLKDADAVDKKLFDLEEKLGETYDSVSIPYDLRQYLLFVEANEGKLIPGFEPGIDHNSIRVMEATDYYRYRPMDALFSATEKNAAKLKAFKPSDSKADIQKLNNTTKAVKMASAILSTVTKMEFNYYELTVKEDIAYEKIKMDQILQAVMAGNKA